MINDTGQMPKLTEITMRMSPYYIPVILGLAVAVPVFDAPAQVAIGIDISVPIAPPPLPVYEQPPIPAEGYIWTPGYWAYDGDAGYYWVPGTWVRPPRVGVLWTPPYWGFEGGVYGFHAGYWVPHVCFFGGIDYGFGYGGVGFEGGRWEGDHIAYNRSVTNISNTRITNVYNKTVVVNNNGPRVGFSGPGGVQARPTAAEEAALREPHEKRTAEQTQHFEAAKANPELRASANQGKPPVAATAKAADFKGPGAVQAKAAGPGAEQSAAIHAPAGRAAAEAKTKPETQGAEAGKEAKAVRPNAEPGAKKEVARPDAAKEAPAKPGEAKRPAAAPNAAGAAEHPAVRRPAEPATGMRHEPQAAPEHPRPAAPPAEKPAPAEKDKQQ